MTKITKEGQVSGLQKQKKREKEKEEENQREEIETTYRQDENNKALSSGLADEAKMRWRWMDEG